MKKRIIFLQCLHFIYKKCILRFSGQIRQPYLIRVDNIYTNADTNELMISFHIANKRVNHHMSVAKFVSGDMIYLVDPRIIFDLGHQFGTHSERLQMAAKEKRNLKDKCVASLKRVFVDE